MESLTYVLVFSLIGASLGSFLNVVAQRSIAGASWWGRERSACPMCGRTLSCRDLFPLFSYLCLRGRCRHCGGKIPLRYVGVELLGAFMGAALFLKWGLSPALLFGFIAAFGLLLNALTDIDEGNVFDVFPLVMGICGLGLRLAAGREALLDGLAGGASAFAAVACIILLSRGGMGWGDATLMAGTGAVLGWKFALLTLYLGFMAGGVISLTLLALGKVKRKDALPLVPFLALGGMAALLGGPWMLSLAGTGPGWPW